MSASLRRAVGVIAAIVILFSAGTATSAAATTRHHRGPDAAAQRVNASGDYTAVVDLASLVPRAVGSNRCEFQVQGTLIFEGTVTGEADGTTTALIFAPCAEATNNPPGTFKDVFRFQGSFAGTVAGVPTTGPLTYAGVTRAGGAIQAVIRLSGDDARAILRTENARVLVGGGYRGVAVTKG